MSSTRSPALAVILTLTAAVGVACSSGDDTGAGTSEIHYAIRSDPGTLDPSASTNSAVGQVEGLAYDALVAVASDGSIESNLATSWDADSRSASFTLDQDVTCDDGHKLTASDIAANFDWIADSKNNSPLLGSV